MNVLRLWALQACSRLLRHQKSRPVCHLYLTVTFELHLWTCVAGACQHALGYHKEAVQDYERAFCMDAGQKDKVPEEARQQQFLAFYQKELALYIRAHLDEPIAARSLDKDLHPVFKVQISQSLTQSAVLCML